MAPVKDSKFDLTLDERFFGFTESFSDDNHAFHIISIVNPRRLVPFDRGVPLNSVKKKPSATLLSKVSNYLYTLLPGQTEHSAGLGEHCGHWYTSESMEVSLSMIFKDWMNPYQLMLPKRIPKA